MSSNELERGGSWPAVRETEGGELVPVSVSAVAAAERAKQEIQSAIAIAKRFPRDELAAEVRVGKACENPDFAKEALYKFPRGNKDVDGPSVHMAREAARVWGNIRYGHRVVAQTDDWVHIMAYAYDAESNAYSEAEDEFSKLVQRKNRQTNVTEWVKPDERDLRELVNRRAAILKRNCILELLPPHIIKAALKKVKETQRAAAAGDLKHNRKATIRFVVQQFDKLGVTTEMLTRYLGHDLKLINDEELTDLRGIGQSIADGNSKREEYFTFGEAKSDGQSEAVSALSDSLKEPSSKK